MAENRKKYAYLNQLSTPQLEELLRMDIEESGTESGDMVFAILELLEQRAQEDPSGKLPDVGRAWADFQAYYDLPEGEEQSLYPQSQGSPRAPSQRPVLHRLLRYGLAAVLAVMAVFGGMLAAQAAGMDVFGAIGRWTDDTFHFVDSPSGANLDYQQVQEALAYCGIDQDLFPTWYPQGFIASEPRVFHNHICDSVTFDLSDGSRERLINVSIEKYSSPELTQAPIFEKDDGDVMVFTSGGRTFYIFSNLNILNAVWSDGVFMVYIWGTFTADQAKEMIRSIEAA